VSVYVEFHGPFFAPYAPLIVERHLWRMTEAVARAGDARVEILHRAYFRQPTPVYWNKPIAKPRLDYHVVTDGGVIYGPWLEGTGSRNKTTRFKGYWSFRTAAQSLRTSIPVIVDPVVRDLCRELNGA
jgi:hypothetical protein